MLLADVNVFRYAHRPESPQHAQHRTWLADVLSGAEPFGVSEAVLASFVRIATRSRVHREPTPRRAGGGARRHLDHDRPRLRPVPGPAVAGPTDLRPVDDGAQQARMSRILRCMTSNTAIDNVLRVYRDYPLRDGDAVLLLDDTVCLEIEQLAAQWDDELRTNTAEIVRTTARTLVVAIARSGRDLRPSDFQLWRELHDALRHDDVDLAPLQSLPAA